MTDFITQKSLDLIDSYSKDTKPFFLYVAHNAPHWPLHALPEDIAKYKDTYKDGWEVLRRTRYGRMVKMGLIDSTTYKLPENSSGESWKDCEKKDYESACMSVHAAMIDHVDQGVGEIIQKLKDKGMYDNTIIFVLSDNGASPERGYGAGFDRPGFTRDSTIIDYKSEHPGSQTTWNYIGRAWASALNTPFRYWKKESYEGGSATPLIVHWPNGLKDEKNTVNRSLTHVIDILPTCVELADAKFPVMINGVKALKPDGRSMLPLLYKKTQIIHDTLFWEHEGGRAIRIGEWKMSSMPSEPWQLFHINEDHTEMNDLATKYPEKVASMDEIWGKWAKSLDIKPKEKKE